MHGSSQQKKCSSVPVSTTEHYQAGTLLHTRAATTLTMAKGTSIPTKNKQILNTESEKTRKSSRQHSIIARSFRRDLSYDVKYRSVPFLLPTHRGYSWGAISVLSPSLWKYKLNSQYFQFKDYMQYSPGNIPNSIIPLEKRNSKLSENVLISHDLYEITIVTTMNSNAPCS